MKGHVENPSLEILKGKLRKFSQLNPSPPLHVEKNVNHVIEWQATELAPKCVSFNYFSNQGCILVKGMFTQL